MQDQAHAYGGFRQGMIWRNNGRKIALSSSVSVEDRKQSA